MRDLLCAGAVALTLLAAGAALAEGRPSAEQMRVMFEAATDALDRGDLAQARERYLEVWSHQQTYDVATNLAGVEYQLGNYLAAAEFTRTALRLFPPSEDPQARAQLASLLEQARGEIGTATIEAPAGAEVKVDGEVVGVAPLDAVFVAPGTHRFEATDGVATVREEVIVSQGAAFTVALTLPDPAPAPTAVAGEDEAAEASAEAPSAPTADADADAGPERAAHRSLGRPLAVVAGGVLTAASLSAHIALRVRAAGLDSDAERALTRADWSTGTGGCAQIEHPACDQLTDLLDRRDRAGIWANVTLGSAVVFGAATIAALTWPRPRRDTAGVVVAPWMTSKIGGLVVRGSLR
jgi:hypothetical protein